MLPLPHRTLPALAVVATGCSATATDLVTIRLADSGPVIVDSACTGDCIDPVTLEVEFAENIAVDPDARISVEQYKVEYAIEAVDVDFFADTISLSVAPGDTGTAEVLPASWEQQDQVYAQVGGDPVSGSATLTVAGHDWNDDVFTVSTRFDITFEDLGDP